MLKTAALICHLDMTAEALVSADDSLKNDLRSIVDIFVLVNIA